MLAAREGLGIARAWALPIRQSLIACPASSSRPVLNLVRRALSSSAKPAGLRYLTGSSCSSLAPRTGSCNRQLGSVTLRSIRHNSTQSSRSANKETEKDKYAEEQERSKLPVDPITAAPPAPALIPSPPTTAQASADTASIMKLLALAKPQWPLLTVGIGCLVVSTGVNLGVPWAIGRIIDYFAPGSEATTLFGLPLEQAVWALAGVLLLGAIANSGRAIALRLAGQRTVARIRCVQLRTQPEPQLMLILGIKRTPSSWLFRRPISSNPEWETRCRALVKTLLSSVRV